MFKLNIDVLFLIFKELQDDKSSLYSCLLVNKTWCKIIIPILWKNPLMNLKYEKEVLQFNVIISHLSNETRRNLDNQGINLPTLQQKPLFNYISYCRYLKLEALINRIFNINNIEYSKLSIATDEILKLLINENTKVTHLYIPAILNYQIHLIPGAENCFSELKFLYCDISSANQNILEGLARIIKSIKILECHVVDVEQSNNSGIIRLIEAQKSLNDIHFYHRHIIKDEFCQALEESLIKHADTIQHFKMDWKPTTKIFSYFVNLISLDINLHCSSDWDLSSGIISLPSSKILANLIENTKGHLTEISISNGFVDNVIIQAIYQNCPNLKYLKLLFNDDIILKLEKLLINCQHLNELVVTNEFYKEIDWNSLFKVLANSSPTSLFMFKFELGFLKTIKLESLKLFFDNWKGRKPMLLTIDGSHFASTSWVEYLELFEKYKAKGIIKKYEHNFDDATSLVNVDWYLQNLIFY